AGVGVADVEVQAGVEGFGLEQADACEFGDGEHRGGDAGVVGGGGGRLEHVGGGDLAFEHRNGGEPGSGGVGGVPCGVDAGVGGALEVAGDLHAVGAAGDAGGVEAETVKVRLAARAVDDEVGGDRAAVAA